MCDSLVDRASTGHTTPEVEVAPEELLPRLCLAETEPEREEGAVVEVLSPILRLYCFRDSSSCSRSCEELMMDKKTEKNNVHMNTFITLVSNVMKRSNQLIITFQTKDKRGYNLGCWNDK